LITIIASGTDRTRALLSLLNGGDNLTFTHSAGTGDAKRLG
jgi:hypothetical protein